MPKTPFLAQSSNTKLTALAFLAIGPLFASQARADFTLHHWEDHYEPVHLISIEGDLLYYSTTENYADDSTKAAVPGLNSYKRIEADATAQFGFADRFSLFGRLAWGRASVDQTAGSAASYGLVDQSLGADFRAYESPLQMGQWTPNSLDIQLQLDFPAYGAAVSDPNTPVLGDHTLDVTPGGFVSIPFWEDDSQAAVLEGGVGYTFRSNHFADQVPWTVGADYLQKTSGIFGGLTGFGIYSMKGDPSTLTIASTGGFSTGSGGSFITDGIDSDSIILRGKIGYQFDPNSQLSLAYERTVWGQNAPAGNNLWIGYRATFGSHAEEHAYEKSNSGLAQYTLDAKVTRVNDRLNLVKINKGSSDGIAKGQTFDIFSVATDGSVLEAVARAQVTSVKSDEAALTIVEYFKEVWVNEGFIAKRLVQ